MIKCTGYVCKENWMVEGPEKTGCENPAKRSTVHSQVWRHSVMVVASIR